MIRVNARLYKAASLFVSDEPSRYYLQGVCVEPHPDGALMVATNGHTLLAVLDRNGRAERAAIIKLPPALDLTLVEYGEQIEHDDDGDFAVKRARCFDRALHVDSSGLASIAGYVAAVDSCTIDGKFPDWRKCMPPGPYLAAAPAFDASRLKKFGDAADLLGNDQSNRPLKIIQVLATDAGGPALVFFSSFRDAAGLIMPVRSAIPQEELKVPSWITPVPTLPPADMAMAKPGAAAAAGDAPEASA